MKKLILLVFLLSFTWNYSQNVQEKDLKVQNDYKEIYGAFEKISPDVVFIKSFNPGESEAEKELEDFYDPETVEFKQTGILIKESGNQKILRFFPYDKIQYVRSVDRVLYIVL